MNKHTLIDFPHLIQHFHFLLLLLSIFFFRLWSCAAFCCKNPVEYLLTGNINFQVYMQNEMDQPKYRN